MANSMVGGLIFIGLLFERVIVNGLQDSLDAYEFWCFLVAIGSRFLISLIPYPYDMIIDILLLSTAALYFGLIAWCGGRYDRRDAMVCLLITCLGSGIGLISGALIFGKIPWFLAHIYASQKM